MLLSMPGPDRVPGSGGFSIGATWSQEVLARTAMPHKLANCIERARTLLHQCKHTIWTRAEGVSFSV